MIGEPCLTCKTEKQIQTMPGMAHFSGTGPDGKTCGQCMFLETLGRKSRCLKYKQMTGKQGAAIHPDCLSCRHFSPSGFTGDELRVPMFWRELPEDTNVIRFLRGSSRQSRERMT